MATDQTRAEAADPNTAAVRLQELATADRELWPLIAANPTAYPALLDWMGEHGDDEVRRVIAARGTEATSVLPPTPPPMPPPAAASAMPPPPGRPLPGQPLGAPAGGSGGGGSKKGLWITLAIVIGLLLAAGIGVGVWALTKSDSDSDNDTDETNTSEPAPTDEETTEPDDEETTEPEDVCDVIDDISDAAYDIYFFLPGSDDVDDLDEAVATLEDLQDGTPEEISDSIDVLIDYADIIAEWDYEENDYEDPPERDDAGDAYYEIDDYSFEEC